MQEYSEILRELLIKRGIENKEQAEIFLNPSYERDLGDPFLMRDMGGAVERLKSAVDAGEKIMIFADYDADGISGAIVFTDFFKRINFSNFKVYIPERNSEGYGLNHEAIHGFKEDGVKLLITVDLGIKAVDEVVLAGEHGMDVIITDHHIAPKVLPQAHSILHPSVGDYPDKNICGAGVAFKFIQAFLKKHDQEFEIKEGMEKWMLDIVAMATIADMVPLLGENRALTHFGLKVLRKSPRVGLHKLFAKLRMDQRHLNEDDLSFMIIPKINAASRMDSPLLAYDFLSTEDETKGDELATYLAKINDERKIMVAGIMKEAKKTLVKREKREVIVIGNPAWRPGVVGLVAGKLVEEYERPVFVWGKDENDLLKGSVRGDGTVSVLSLMQETTEYFTEFGGHYDAGGFTVETEKIHFLEDALVDAFTKIFEEKKDIKAEYDIKLTLEQVNMKIWKDINRLAPFGIGNPKPVFLFEGVRVEKVHAFGKNNSREHLEIVFSDSEATKVKSISFFTKPDSFSKTVAEGIVVNLLASFDLSYFAGRKELRLRIVDVY